MLKSDAKKRPTLPESIPKIGKVPIELPSKRKGNRREFLNPDGSITLELYQKPIFWKNKHGQWLEINNNIVPSKELTSFPFKNASNDLDIWFAQGLTNQAINRIQYKDNFVEFIPQNYQKTVGVTNGNQITYPKIYPSVDLKYSVFSTGVKEDIILNDANAQNMFSFAINTKGLTPKLNKDGTISFLNKEQDEIFRSAKPFALDSKNIVTDQITSSLRQVGDQWYLDVTLDSSWLKDPNRAFPVTIDPTINFQPNNANTQDTFAASSYPNNNYATNTWLAAGTNSFGINRSFLWFNLPSPTSGAVIQSASLELNQFVSDTNNHTTVEIHRISKSWSASSVTWNNMPSFEVASIDAKTSNAVGAWSFDVTSTVKGWYDGKVANYGFMLKASGDESANRRGFDSSENGDASKNPKLVIKYLVDPIGDEDFWTNDGNVNMQNGNLFLNATDVYLPGRGVPLNITRSYNSRSNENNPTFGFGWRLNVGMSLDYQDPYPSKVIVFTDSDGTKHIFTEPDGQDGMWEAPSGVDLDLEYKAATATDPAYYIIKDRSQTKYYFDYNTRKLEAIIDSNNNVTDLAYNTDGTLKNMTDASGRVVNFNYAGGKLDSMTGTEIPTVKYAYNASGDLISVTKSNSAGTVLSKVSYGYDVDHNVISVTDPKGNLTNIAYYSSDRVDKIFESINGGATTYTTDYGYAWSSNIQGGFITNVVDPKGITTRYETNANGNVLNMTEDSGVGTKNLSTEYTWDSNNHLTNIKDPRGNNTTYLHDPNGRIINITNTKNDNQKFWYDKNNNMISAKDFGGEMVKNNFDMQTNNEITTSNTLLSTSGNQYDRSGNIIKTSLPIGDGNNMVVNNGFEDWSSTSLPKNWSNIGAGTVSQDNASTVNGNYSVNLSSSSSTDIAKLASEYLPVKGNTMYNFSWFVRPYKVAGSANVKIEWYSDKASTSLISTTSGLANAKGSGWMRKGARETSPSNATYARLVVYVDSGSARFDDMQMEEGTFVNESNYVTNHGFEYDNDQNGIPDGWSIESAANSANDGIDLTSYHTGQSSVLLNGGSTQNKFFGQNISLAGKKGTILNFSGWSKSTGVSSTGGDYLILLRVDYNDGTTGWYGAPFSKVDHMWEYQERSLTISKAFSSIGIYEKYMNQTGQAWFDDVKVRALVAPNAMMSEYNIAQNGSFEYDLDGNGQADQWEPFIQAGTTATMSWQHNSKDNNIAYIGDSVASIANSGGWAVYGNRQNEPIRGGKTYTASTMIKADKVSTGGGVLKIDLYDSTGKFLGDKKSETISGSKNWMRVFVSITQAEANQIASANGYTTTPTSMKISVGTVGKTTGTVYFDAVRWQSQSITTNISYDTKGNYVSSVTDPLGQTTSYQTDNRGNIKRMNYPNTGTYNLFGYNDLNLLTYLENATELGVNYQYDLNSNLKKIVFQDNGTGLAIGSVLQDYNELDQLIKRTDQNGKATSFQYDPNGNLTDITYPNAKAVHFGYDSVNQLTSTSYTGDSTTWSYSYDNNGNITNVTKNGTESTDYSIHPSLNQVDKVTFPNINGIRNYVSYKYHPSGQITSIINSPISANPIKYEYDHSGRMEKVIGTNGEWSTHMYDEIGRLKKTYTWDGTNRYVKYFDYNEAGFLKRLRQETGDGTTISDDTFIYDGNDNLTETSHLDGSKDIYSYDLSNRLKREQQKNAAGTITSDISYTYDVMGNRKTKTEGTTATDYSYDMANQLISVNGQAYSYDANGNLISNGKNTYHYNAENQLTSVQNSAGTTIAIYEYNQEGGRTKKVSNGQTEMYYYNAGQLAYITDGSGKLRYSFTRNASGQLLTMTDYTGTAPVNYYYMINSHGDVLGLRDKSGSMVVSYGYDAFGNPTSASGTATTGDGKLLKDANPFRYASYVFDNETYLYYLNSRYYSPSLGRFITRDAIESANEYIYANDNPVRYVDPDGTWVLDAIWLSVDAASFIANPSWAGAAWLVGDTASFLDPTGSVSTIAHSARARSVMRVAKGTTKLTKRDELLSTVSNKKLKNTVNEMYRPGATTGDGGLAAAIRVETKYGQLVGGKSHIQKGWERVRNLENIMRNEKLSDTDWKIANNLVIDLKRALNGK